MGRPPLFLLLFMSIFGFIGIAVLVFLWGPGDGMGEPPLIFRIFGSLIAMGFILIGFGAPLSLMRKRKGPVERLEQWVGKGRPAGFDCPKCGANLGKSEVSPSGDVKCSYCGGWFNIRRK